MTFARLLRHLLLPDWLVLRAFSRGALRRIEAAIRDSEKLHAGELRFAVEAGLDPGPLLRGASPRQRALELFSELRVWDTAANSGVLIYVELVDRRIEIVADRGIAARVEQHEWDAICRRMESAFRAGEFEAGAVQGIAEATRLLARHFPPPATNPDELSNRPVVL
jgi:uncharacterized membrane protein